MISNIIIEIKKDKENYTMLESKFFCKSQNYPGHRECRNRRRTILTLNEFYMFFRTIVIIMKKKTSPQQNFIVMKGKKKVKQVMKLDANKVLKKN